MSIKEALERKNREKEAADAFLRAHPKGSAVWFSDVDKDPLIVETIEVLGPEYKVVTKDGSLTRRKKARIVVLSNNELEVIGGGHGASLLESDARRILNHKGKVGLTRSLKPKNSVK